MILLDGNKIADKRADVLKQKIEELDKQPHLLIIQVGERSDSVSFIKRKISFGEKIGAKVTVNHFEESVTTEELKKEISKANEDEDINGIIVQLPLPEHVSASEVINSIRPKKDVDGLSAFNIRALNANEKGIIPATAKGIVTLLEEYNISVQGKNVTIIGRSLLVGRSSAMHFTNNNATVTLCHTQTVDLEEQAKKADIVVIAIGSPRFLTKDFIREGQVIVDVGISKDGERQVAGDVDFDEVKDIVDAISPVPGGVGPMTVLSLYENLLENI